MCAINGTVRAIPFKVLVVWVLGCFITYGQESGSDGGKAEFFHEIEVGKLIVENEQWTLDVTASWKHLYADEAAWRRWGGVFSAKRKHGNWSFMAGMANYYTFHADIDNFFQLRPWVAIGLKTPITERLDFVQRFRPESLTFIYSGTTENDTYSRWRYRLGLDYNLSEDEETLTAWKIQGSLEWYFLKNPSSGERYPITREYTLKLVREMVNGHEIGFGYRLEEFYESAHHEGGPGHTLILEYRW
ncbi:MAG: hypothetical protein AB3N16_01395 [Flavobacteriaceae bacterium]